MAIEGWNAFLPGDNWPNKGLGILDRRPLFRRVGEACLEKAYWRQGATKKRTPSHHCESSSSGSLVRQ
jgi:hypothetical protein